MAEEKTESKTPSLSQIVGTIRKAREDLDGLENLVHTTANQRGTFDLVADAMLNAKWRIAEARMWLGRALAELGEPNTSEYDDKTQKTETIMEPSRRPGPDTSRKS